MASRSVRPTTSACRRPSIRSIAGLMRRTVPSDDSTITPSSMAASVAAIRARSSDKSWIVSASEVAIRFSTWARSATSSFERVRMVPWSSPRARRSAVLIMSANGRVIPRATR